MTAFWKDGDMDPVLFSIFPNDVDEEAHSVLIKFDKDADFVSRVNLEGLETWWENEKKKIQFEKKNASSALWEK